MKYPRLLPLLALLPALLLLSGCFDLYQEVWINPDGSGRLVIDTGVAKELATMPDENSGRTFIDNTRQRYAGLKKEFQKDKGVSAFKVREYDKNELHHFVCEVSLKDATRIGEFYRRLTASEDGEGPNAENVLSVTKDAEGNFVFTHVLEGGSEVKAEAKVETKAEVEAKPEGQPAPEVKVAAEGQASTSADEEEFTKAMAASLFPGLYITTKVHGPGIVKTNGTLDKDKKGVEWKMPLAELASQKAFRKELSAVVSVKGK